MIRRIGILTGGGDAPGLNAAIRAVVKSCATSGIECLGLQDGFEGLVPPGRTRVLTLRDLPGILRLGGTILGTSARGNPFATSDPNSKNDGSPLERALERCRTLGLEGLIVIGGDGTLGIAHGFHQRGMPVVVVPKTIDNDVPGTSATIGFDTAVACATDAIDRLHDTGDAHHRVMVVEVMGRYTGWIAIHAGIAGGADAVLLPEIPFDLGGVARRLLEREQFGARFSVVVVAEGARAVGGERVLAAPAAGGRAERLGGIGERVARELAPLTGKETRHTVLGHLQRGGRPTSYDRLLATRFGRFAADAVGRGESGIMVALRSGDVVAVPIDEVVGRPHQITLDSDIVHTARSLGIALGD